MIMITIVITIVKPCNKTDKSDTCIENDDDFANNKPVTIETKMNKYERAKSMRYIWPAVHDLKLVTAVL